MKNVCSSQSSALRSLRRIWQRAKDEQASLSAIEYSILQSHHSNLILRTHCVYTTPPSMLSQTLLTSAALLISFAYGAPAVAGAPLSKRGEGIHLVNCFATGSTADVVSAVAVRTAHSSSQPKDTETRVELLTTIQYCPNDGNCKPGPNHFCTVSSGDSIKFIHWEGAPFHCTFNTGVTFSWNLPDDAQSKATFSVVE
jgi:hypothetical protein